eukprot:TRINITY_DN8312_c0_g1_i1.p1 TRINITY_DN8312_c0_g1~~TRINITY_DN8312_c0_g1_i1.p1  ORF type:complete len:298 (-),score=52.88 TRINITY_DN8312_c0_g1_i1:87-980(-)
MSIKEILNTKIKDVLHPKPLVTATDSDKVSDVLQKLIAHKLLSLPVFSEREKRFKSFVDIVDIVCHAVNILENSKTKDYDTLMKVDAFANERCGSIVIPSFDNQYFSITENDTLRKAIHSMVNLLNVRRMPVLGSGDALVGVLSQSQVINFISKYAHLLPFANKTVGDLGVGSRQVPTLSSSQSVREAFWKIKHDNASGVAIVNSDGKLIGNISASDIKVIGIDASLFSKMELPVSQVLASINAKPKPVSVSTSTTIDQLFKVFHEEHIHRIYIEDQRELIGVISLIDLINLVDLYC